MVTSGFTPYSDQRKLSNPKKPPRVCFLGFCDRSLQISQDHVALEHVNLLGLSSSKVSFMYPWNLRGLTLALSVFQPTVGEKIVLRFREPEKNRSFEISIGISSTV